ncbi:MAG: ChaN family lipoprotein [Opitutaceae bacterium]|nr:ChaN family lipoprotein [Opitutaceae bacterium]
MKFLPLSLAGAMLALAACTSVPPPVRVAGPLPRPPREFWLDLVSGDEIAPADLLEDVATAGVVYAGETHTIARHHAVQLSLLQELFARRVPLVLCLEQLEARDQPAVDRYNAREIDFATLAREIDWPSKWRNYLDYQPLCDFARQHGIPVRGLNAPADLIRAISRGGGVAQLTPEQRAQLPADLRLDDPDYERLTNLQLAVHVAADPAKLRPMFEAQLARDEVMAANIVAARGGPDAGAKRTAFVVLGAGHTRFGLGTAASVRRRETGIVERLILVSESGELELTAAEKAQSRDVTISHADLRSLGRPPGDYVRILPRSTHALPAGHPPITR